MARPIVRVSFVGVSLLLVAVALLLSLRPTPTAQAVPVPSGCPCVFQCNFRLGYEGTTYCDVPPCGDEDIESFEDWEDAMLEVCSDLDCWPEDMEGFYEAWLEACGSRDGRDEDQPKPGEGCGGSEEGGGSGAGGGNLTTNVPVDTFYGDKIESATDLAVPYTGGMFFFSREYTSDPEYQGANLIGNNWTSPTFQFIETFTVGSSCSIRIGGMASHSYGTQETFSCSLAFGSEVPVSGRGDEVFEKTKVFFDDLWYPVWRLKRPGRGHRDFFRENDAGETGTGENSYDWKDVEDEVTGLLFQRVDVYGNSEVFSYVINGPVARQVARLDTVQLNPPASGDPEAEIRFSWIDESLDLHGNNNKLEKIEVIRWDSSTEATTREVEYTYFDSSPSQHEDLGSDGDLIQVVCRELVDDTEDVSGPDWREKVTQYRYHTEASNNASRETGFPYAWDGNPGQLKLVILPEQIEYFAEVEDTAPTATVLPSEKSDDLFNDADDDDLGDGLRIVDLAAKIVEQYEEWDDQNPLTKPGRVETQFVLSSCGCGGVSTTGIKLEYAHFDWNQESGTGTYLGHTLKISERRAGDDYASIYRTQYFDSELFGDAPGTGEPDLRVPYTVTDARIEGTSGLKWVNHVELDEDTRTVTFRATPSAMSSYTPATETTAPSYSASTTSGLVYGYKYSDGATPTRPRNYRTEVRVQKGWDESNDDVDDFELVSRTTYHTAVGFEYLPIKVERFREEGLTGASPSPTSNDDVEVVEYDYSFHTLTGHDIAHIETEVEAELTGENGPGGKYYAYSFFNTSGHEYWSRSADGSMTRREFDSRTGLLEVVERNADNSSGQSGLDTSGLQGSFAGRNGDGGSLTTTYTRDLLGRIIETISPGGVSTYILREMRRHEDDVMYFTELHLPHEIDPGNAYGGPATLKWYTAGGQHLRTSEYELSASYTLEGGSSGPVAGYTLGDELGRVADVYNETGLRLARREFTEMPYTFPYPHYETEYEYDDVGRLTSETSAIGSEESSPDYSVTDYKHDVLDRVVKVSVGTDAVTPVTQIEYVYDGSGMTPGAGNGNLTRIREHVDSSDSRDTTFTYDYRDRQIKAVGELPPHVFRAYDNLDRVTHAGIFEDVPSDTHDFSASDSDRTRLTHTLYSQRGLVHTARLATAPTSGYTDSSDALETMTWRDEAGRVVATVSPNAAVSKQTYDGNGRVKISYVTDGRDGTTYADMYDTSSHEAEVAGDVVLVERINRYIDGASAHGGQLDLVTAYQRTHDAGTTLGALSSFSGGDTDKRITTYQGYYYDDADRLLSSVDFGTNSSSGFVSGTTAPTITQGGTPDSSAIVNTRSYNERGLIEIRTAPDGDEILYVYDDLNRTIAVVENYDDFDPSTDLTWSSTNNEWQISGSSDGALGDQDRVTTVVYDADHRVLKETAHYASSSDDQVTEYIYGVVTSGSLPSAVASDDYLYEVVYPAEQASGGATAEQRTFRRAYNRLGEIIAVEDQNDTVHDYYYDELGRVIGDSVTIASNDIDSSIEAIAASYDDSGRLSKVTSYSDYFDPAVNPPTATPANEVEFEYNVLWQTTVVKQEYDGAVDGSSVELEYAFDTDVSDNISRVSDVEYPDNNRFYFGYGASGSVGDRISRIHRIYEITQGGLGAEEDLSLHDYIGLNRVAIVDYPVPDVQLDRTAAHNGSRQYLTETNNPGAYPGYDRFGRIARQTWVDGDFSEHATDTSVPNQTPLVELVYSYDLDSNVDSAYDGRPGALIPLSHEYTYDGLDRLVAADRGEWDGSTFTAGTGSQAWDLDTLGNWEEISTDSSDDARGHNDVNELAGRDLDGDQSDDLTYTYDHNGNLAREDDVAASTGVIYTHDAWNRLVKVEFEDDQSTVTTRAQYWYNGLNWRIRRSADKDLDTTVDEVREMYYALDGRLLEERVHDGATQAVTRHVQYLPGIQGQHDVIFHRENTDPGTDNSYEDTEDEVFYHLTDYHLSTVAIISEAARIKERVTYTAYGVALHHVAGDVDGDGDADYAGDRTIIADLIRVNAAIGDSNYRAEADLYRDGVINNSDLSMWAEASSAGDGAITSSAVDNQIGFNGYVFNADQQQYSLLLRLYDPNQGRWLERDPAGCIDGLNLYQFVTSNPNVFIDLFGLCSTGICYADSTLSRPATSVNAGWPSACHNTVTAVSDPRTSQGMSSHFIQFVNETEGLQIIWPTYVPLSPGSTSMTEHGGRVGVSLGVVRTVKKYSLESGIDLVYVKSCGGSWWKAAKTMASLAWIALKSNHDAEKAFPNNPGSEDAFRHCLWSCRMQKKHGTCIAELVAAAHEVVGNAYGQRICDAAMDTHNNYIGRRLGRSGSGQCSRDCLNTLTKGDLFTSGAAACAEYQDPRARKKHPCWD